MSVALFPLADNRFRLRGLKVIYKEIAITRLCIFIATCAPVIPVPTIGGYRNPLTR